MKLTRIILIATIFTFALNLNAQQEPQEYIKAYMHTEGKIWDNNVCQFRLKEDLELENVTIPKNTFFRATTSFTEDRVYMDVKKIEFEEKIYDVNLRILGRDLTPGFLRTNPRKKFVWGYSGEYKFIQTKS